MHEFRFIDNELCCEKVRISDIARKVDTPFYLYSHKTLIDHYMKLRVAFRSIRPLICFSVKSNSNLAILRALVKKGAGLDIVSGGELYRAKLSGVDPKKVVYAGVGKKPNEIEEAVRFGILLFNVESEEELAAIQAIARRLKRRVGVAIRINPDVMPKTHSHITTGKGDTKFGLDFETAHKIFNSRWKYPDLAIKGVHIHIGSQIVDAKPFQEAIKKVVDFIDENRIEAEYFNIGGGLGIVYALEHPQTADHFARNVLPILKKAKLKIILEPGRFISGPAGVLVTRVIYTKRTPRRNFVIVDSGMNDLLRPSIYAAYHKVVPVQSAHFNSQDLERVDVVGPICETGDFLAKDRLLSQARSGDLLAVMGAGAYGFTMSSNYNSRPRAAEVLVMGKRSYVVRSHESYRDLVRLETIPKALR